jgi:superfamily II DNA or RNA helicase
MSFSINNINKCKNLSNDKIKLMANKFHIKLKEKINNNNRDKICNQINRIANEINPCGIILHKNSNITLKKHQINVSNKLVKNRGIIAVHSVGTGKTLTAISSSQCLLKKNIIEHIIVITPTSLQKNFITQSIQYGITQKQLDTYYTFYTIQGISNAVEHGKATSPSKSLIIIDEAHNLRTINGSRFESIFKYTKKAEKVLLLTATPLINYPIDIINLLALATGEKPISEDIFNKMLINNNIDNKFKKYIKDIFDFYIKDYNIPDPNFPSKKILEIFLPMDSKYLKIYESLEHGQDNKQKLNKEYNILDFDGKNIHVFYNGLRRASNIIDKKSPKVDWIKEKIISNLNSKYVIFSHFINMGIVPIMKWLKKINIPYAHVTGDLTIEERDKAVIKYNNDEIKILFISKAGSEGLDLKNTRNIIIMESAWNENSIEQIIGRGVRYNSHKSLPKSKQNITIYKLYAIKPNEYKYINKITSKHLLKLNINDINDMISVDLYLRNYSWLKQQILNKFEKILIKNSKN